MNTYSNKKKLLEENNDLYISPYDKNLPTDALSGVIEAKRDYNKAKDANDTYSMQKANQKANSIRSTYGSYLGGADGSEYNKSSYEIRPDKYKSKYQDDIDLITKKLKTKGSFNYKVENDPLYEIYKKVYSSLGDDAYQRTLADMSVKTGGVPDSSAYSLAMLNKNNYNKDFMDMALKLYEKAYQRHSDDTKNLYELLGEYQKLDESDYKKYQGDIDAFENDRDYFYKKTKDYKDDSFNLYKYDSDYEYDLLKDAKESEEFSEKLASERDYKNYNLAINLAKAMYGKVPISQSVIQRIFNIISATA